MSIIAGTGPTSGINYDQLISNLLELERQPIERLESKKTAYNNKISAYNTLSSKLSALKSAADKLRTTSNFYAKSASVTDSTVLEATASSSAAVGNYSIAVTQLASAHSITHNTGLADKGTTTVLASGNTFSFTINSETKTITASSNLTLEQLASQINSVTYTGNVKVGATVVNTGTTSSPSYKLILTSNTSGAGYGITVNSDASILDLAQTSTSDSDSDGQYRVQLTAAQDAQFTANSLSVTRSSNTVSDVITGVTFTLKKGSSSATLTVTDDRDTISQNIQALVTAYNDVVSYVSTNSTYDTKTHKGGVFHAESTSRSIVDRLRNIIITAVSGLSSDLNTLAEIGISTNRDGTLSVNTSTLNSKLSSNLTDVANLFTDSNGIGNEIYDYTDSVTKSITGTIAIKVDGLGDTVSDISEDITKLEERLEITERNLRRQFSSLESLLGSLTTQGQFLGNLITALNG